MRDSETERENEAYKLFELKNEIGAWGPKGEEGKSQDNMKRRADVCSAI